MREATERATSRSTATNSKTRAGSRATKSRSMLLRPASGRASACRRRRDRASHHPRLGRRGRRCLRAERAASMSSAPASRCWTWSSASTQFPRPDVKTQASEFSTVNGGNAANAAVAIARLGARASFAGPLGGPAGSTRSATRCLALTATRRYRLRRRACASTGVAVADLGDLRSTRGERTIVELSRRALIGGARRTIRRRWSRTWTPCSPTTAFRPSCARSARRRASAAFRSCSMPTSRATTATIAAHASRSHVIFSAEGSARDRRHRRSRRAALIDVSQADEGVPRRHRRAERRALARRRRAAADAGVQGRRRRYARRRRHVPRRASRWAGRRHECEREAMRLRPPPRRSNARAIGGILGAPTRAEVEAFLAKHD